jgi:hypothetical protein
MTNIRVLHNKNNPYVQINRKSLQNSKLSWEARGLWAYLLSLPNDWNINVKHLVTQSPAGIKKIYTLLTELKDNGLCYLLQRRQKDGKWQPAEYLIAESAECLRQELKELKKCLPHTLLAHAVKGDVILTKYSTKKELSKESKKVVATAPPLSLLSFGEYEILKLKEGDYKSLCAKYGTAKVDEELIKADRWLEQEGKKKKNYKAFMQNWMEREWNKKPSKETLSDKNKAHAIEIVKNLKENHLPKKYEIDILSSHMEIHDRSIAHCDVLNFSENGFKDQLESILRKLNIINYLTKNCSTGMQD